MAVLSVNKNLIKNNPFTGDNAGLTWNYELVADTTLNSKWAVGLNLGYRDWRVYAGLNWALGPVCDTNVFERFKGAFDNGPEVFTVDLHLLFAPNSDQIIPSRLARFDESYKKIAGTGFERLEIEGHTDSVGAAAYNLDLSQRRANFVRNHLINTHKVSPSKIEAKGYGEVKPIADNGNYQGRQKNRRVEFKVWRK